MYSQFVRSGRVHSLLRHCATLYAAVRRLSAHGAHTFWRRSPNSIPGPGELRCGGKENMSMRHSFAEGTPRTGRLRSDGASIAANLPSRRAPVTQKRSATWSSCIVKTYGRWANALGDPKPLASPFLNIGWGGYGSRNSTADGSSSLEKNGRAKAQARSLSGSTLVRAAAVHGVILSVEPLTLAHTALARLGLVGKGNERDRRPTQDELDRLGAPVQIGSERGEDLRWALRSPWRAL